MTLLVLMQLGAGEGLEAEVRGEAPEMRVASVEQREAVRFHGGIHFAVAGGFSGFAPGGGPGLSGDLGVTFADRFSISVRGTVGTIVVVSCFMAGLAFDYALSDRFSLGVAPSIALLGGVLFVWDMPGSVAVSLPLRLSFAPFGRAEHEVARKGLVLFAEVGPGYGLVMSAGFVPSPPPRPSPVSFTAAIGVGYSVW